MKKKLQEIEDLKRALEDCEARLREFAMTDNGFRLRKATEPLSASEHAASALEKSRALSVAIAVQSPGAYNGITEESSKTLGLRDKLNGIKGDEKGQRSRGLRGDEFV